MFNNSFYPLRSVVGNSVPISRISPITPLLQNFQLVCIPNSPNFPSQSMEEKTQINIPNVGNIYSHFLPVIINNQKEFYPAQGMATMPVPQSNLLGNNFPPILDFLNSPSDIPFSANDHVASIFGFKTTNFQEYGVNINSDNSIQGKGNPFLSNADGTFSFLVLLEQERLVGGICFSGYPYITSRIEKGTGGMTLGNFGLPREIRIMPLPTVDLGKNPSATDSIGYMRNQFIDSEYTYSRQEIISHSGLNYLCIDPVKTNLFLLTVTDLPFIINKINIDNSLIDDNGKITLKTEGYKGFAIPYLYFFEYNESTRRNARLHSGLVGVKSGIEPRNKIDDSDILKLAFPEYEFLLSEKGYSENSYVLFTAHSVLGQKRSFSIKDKLNYPSDTESLPQLVKTKDVEEMFISDTLNPGEKVTLFIQQGEEYNRCVAGLKIFLPMLPEDVATATMAEQILNLVSGNVILDRHLDNDERKLAEEILAFYLGVPDEVNFCNKLNIKVFEIDPIEGISPAAVELDSKYATLLIETQVNDFKDIVFNYFLKGIPFKRISASKYFAIELTNSGDEEGKVVIHSMHLVRSAHVSVQPRAAKTQQVKALHYRIIGPDLADDFSKLGSEGFNFSIDRVVAGQTKNVLYNAMSLLDLLHTGGARIQSNIRRRAQEFEMIENFREETKNNIDPKYFIKHFPQDDFSGKNYENREIDNTATGWRSMESGNGVDSNGNTIKWPLQKGIPSHMISDFEFESYSSSETRSRTEQVSSILDPAISEVETLAITLNGLTGNFFSRSLLAFGEARDTIFKQHNQANLWKPFRRFGFDINDLPAIGGLQTLNIPPFFLTYLDMFTRLSGLLNFGVTAMTRGSAHSSPPLQIRTNDIDNIISQLSLINGLSIGYNIGNNVGTSVGASAAVNASPLGFGLSGSESFGASLGASGGYSLSVNSNLNSAMRSSTNGAIGSILQTGQETKYSVGRSLQQGYDNSVSESEMKEGEVKRIVSRRELLNRDGERVRGAEVMWQGKIQDIITGSVPLNFTLPATATKMNFRTADDTLRIRFNSGFSSSIEVDFWFELTEEIIRDDY